jgi:hypothetical protein
MRKGLYYLQIGRRRGEKRPPLRTFKEMAEEFGVTPNTLSSLTGFRGGPSPILVAGTVRQQAWYDPAGLRAWWDSIHNEDGTLRKVGE